MPLSFFDTDGPGGICRDEEGVDLPSLVAVERYARRALCEIAGDHQENDVIAFSVRVYDPTGTEVYRASLTLSGVLPISHSLAPSERSCRAPDA